MSCRVILYDRKGNEVCFRSIAALSREINVTEKTIRNRANDNLWLTFGDGYRAKVRRDV